MDTEGGRISRVIEAARRCDAAQSLARARMLGAANAASCKRGCGEKAPKVLGQETPLSSDLLQARVSACTPYISPYKCVPESTRIAAVDLCVRSAYVDQLNPEQRFAEYRRPYFPPPCPPIPQEALNANVPKMQLKNCPLPNKPYNPVLPG